MLVWRTSPTDGIQFVTQMAMLTARSHIDTFLKPHPEELSRLRNGVCGSLVVLAVANAT
jgi:hypothetical protein